jgi:hypothetical protein
VPATNPSPRQRVQDCRLELSPLGGWRSLSRARARDAASQLLPRRFTRSQASPHPAERGGDGGIGRGTSSLARARTHARNPGARDEPACPTPSATKDRRGPAGSRHPVRRPAARESLGVGPTQPSILLADGDKALPGQELGSPFRQSGRRRRLPKSAPGSPTGGSRRTRMTAGAADWTVHRR